MRRAGLLYRYTVKKTGMRGRTQYIGHFSCFLHSACLSPVVCILGEHGPVVLLCIALGNIAAGSPPLLTVALWGQLTQPLWWICIANVGWGTCLNTHNLPSGVHHMVVNTGYAPTPKTTLLLLHTHTHRHTHVRTHTVGLCSAFKFWKLLKLTKPDRQLLTETPGSPSFVCVWSQLHANDEWQSERRRQLTRWRKKNSPTATLCHLQSIQVLLLGKHI